MDVKTGKEQQNFLIITSCRWSKYLDYIIVFLPIWTSSQSDYFTHQLEDMQIMSCFKYHCSKHLNIRANLKASTWKKTGSKMASVRPMCMCKCVYVCVCLYAHRPLPTFSPCREGTESRRLWKLSLMWSLRLRSSALWCARLSACNDKRVTRPSARQHSSVGRGQRVSRPAPVHLHEPLCCQMPL